MAFLGTGLVGGAEPLNKGKRGTEKRNEQRSGITRVLAQLEHRELQERAPRQ
jgi:hypothetical protein